MCFAKSVDINQTESHLAAHTTASVPSRVYVMGSIITPDWLLTVGHNLAFMAWECVLVVAVTLNWQNKGNSHASFNNYKRKYILF